MDYTPRKTTTNKSICIDDDDSDEESEESEEEESDSNEDDEYEPPEKEKKNAEKIATVSTKDIMNELLQSKEWKRQKDYAVNKAIKHVKEIQFSGDFADYKDGFLKTFFTNISIFRRMLQN